MKAVQDERLIALRKRVRHPTAILTDAEVQLITDAAEAYLDGPVGELIRMSRGHVADLVRWSSLQEKCRRAREAHSFDIKAIARKLDVPQYRLKAIETGNLQALDPNLAARYFSQLGIRPWVYRWIRSNFELALKAGLADSRARAGTRPVPRQRKTQGSRGVGDRTRLIQR